MWHPPFSTYNTHSSPFSTYSTHFPPILTYLDNLSQQLFRKLFNCFTAAVSVQRQPFYHFSLVKNQPEGPPLRRLLKFHEIVRILIHIRIRLNFHVRVLYVYIYLYISYTYFMDIFMNPLSVFVYLYVFRLPFFVSVSRSIYVYIYLCGFSLALFRWGLLTYLRIRL